MQYFSKTKLIATYGPSLENLLKLDVKNKASKLSTQQVKEINKLCQAGVNVIRFNMSHDSLEIHKTRFTKLRQLATDSKNILGIMIDTKGPEIRVGSIKSDASKNVIHKNATVKIFTNKPKHIGDGKSFSVSDITHTYNLANDLTTGDVILIDDGKLVLVVKEVDPIKGVITTVSDSTKYTIKANKRVNLFNKSYSLPFINDYDKKTIEFAVNADADFLALSFISNVKQLEEVKKIIQEINPQSQLKIICKIETLEAVKNIESLVANSDGIMVARGDLSLEIGYENVPIIQDKILELCNQDNKICIVATQMLDSLETRLLPTRAEVTDCFYAVKSFADSTMLSSESAASDDPINAINVMKKITNQAEKDLAKAFNFNAMFFQQKFVKKLLKKISCRTYENKNILLKMFSEEEIRVITNSLINKNFFILASDYPNFTKLTLYKNLNILLSEADLELHPLEKK